jgi:hypothetical protein
MLEFENLVPRQIVISGSSNKGFIVQCGCCTCVFTDKKEMVNAILDYINDPDKIEREYNNSQKTPRGLLATAEDCSCEQQGESRNASGSGVGMIRHGNINPCAEAPMTERRR